MSPVVLVSNVPTLRSSVVDLVREYLLLPDAWVHAGGPPGELPQFFLDDLERLPEPATRPFGDIAVYVDERGDTAGVALLVPFDEGRAEIKRLYVRPTARGQGVGKSLVVELLGVATALGYDHVVLDVMPSRSSAIRLYEALGFEATAAFREYDVHEMLYLTRPVR